MGTCCTADAFQNGNKEDIEKIIKKNNQKRENGNKNIIPLDKIEEIKKSICKISYERYNKKYFRLGFFLESEEFPKCIITNTYDAVEQDLSNDKIKVEIFNKKNINIELNGQERYIQVFGDAKIILIELKDSDEIIKDIHFLECDKNFVSESEQNKNINIFYLKYINDIFELKEGKIEDYGENYFIHTIDVNPDVLGSPIFSLNTLKVIGIQKETKADDDDDNKLTNYGAFIGEIFRKILYNKDIYNYIIGEIDNTENYNNYNNALYIINFYENYYYRNQGEYGIVKEYKNENEINECLIEIGNIIYPFSEVRFFKKTGKYKIKYYFINLLTNCIALFYNCSYLVYLDFSNFDTKNVKYMLNMFENCSSLADINFKNFNTEKVVNINSMFYNCSSLKRLDLSNFNTKNVNNMGCLFYGCSSLIDLCISNFDTSNVKIMNYMFNKCLSLKSLNLSNFNTEKVENMLYMFNDCRSLEELNISSFNTEKVVNLSYTFGNCHAIKYLNISNFNTKNVKRMNGTFYGCDITKFTLPKFNTENVIDMSYMFASSSCNNLDLSHFNTENVEKMNYMFYGCSSLMSLDLSNFNTKMVKDMEGMFCECKNLKYLNLSSFNTENVENMEQMFYRCSSLTSLDLSNFNTQKVVSISEMFYECDSLEIKSIKTNDPKIMEQKK